MNIKIVGNGAWGKAMFHVLQKNNLNVNFIKRNEDIKDVDIVVLAVPTQAIKQVLSLITFSKKKICIVNTAKGIEQLSHRIPYQIIYEMFKNRVDYYTLIGPSFAEEVINDMPTLVNLGYAKESKDNERIKLLFQTNYFRIRLCKGVEALELSSALKNVYAIGCGLAKSLGYKINTRVKLIVMAIEEMQILFRNLHYHNDERSVAGTIGDLVLTCNSMESRNFHFGTLLPNYRVEECLTMINSTVEGFHTLSSISYLEQKSRAKLPLASFINKVIRLNQPKLIDQEFRKFIMKV
ncbi:MAG: hypothetical protein Q7R95_01635 [bacterium]|nr:hypothetical protein [bacterium]